MKKNILRLSLFSCIFFSSMHALAYEKIDVYRLSLEDLLNINVVSASRKEEKQQLAPGIVSVISAQEIQQYGARHLRDIIDRLVGIQVLGSHLDFHGKTSLRAINSSHREDTVLVMLNGRPLRQGTDGGINTDLYIGFPIKSIERIEVIRGPGSVIYGTNATAGVINIITRDAKDSVNMTETDLSVGSFATRQAQISSLSGDKNYSLNLELNYLSSDGDPVEDITDMDGNTGTYETGVNSSNLLVNARYKNVTSNIIAMKNRQDSAGSAFQLPSSTLDLERYFIDLGYLHKLSNDWDLSFNYSFSEVEVAWQINESVGDNFSTSHTQIYESILRGKAGENLNLLFGASYTANDAQLILGLPSGSENANTSAYAQVDYMHSPSQKLIAGLQWNKPDKDSSDLSPRLGLIQGFAKRWWLKLLYSEAYRSPNLLETSIDAPQLKGVSTLEAENIATYDAQLIYRTPRHYWALALYHSELEDLIVRVPGSPTTFGNVGSVRFKGVEIEGRIELNSSFSMIVNASYQENITDTGVENGTFAPQVMLKLGASYENARGLSLAIFNSYIGESTDLSETHMAPELNPEASSYNLLTANVSIDTGKMWSLGKPGHSIVSLYLDNLLDEDVFSPDLNFSNANNTIPHHWGMGAYLTYSYRI